MRTQITCNKKPHQLPDGVSVVCVAAQTFTQTQGKAMNQPKPLEDYAMNALVNATPNQTMTSKQIALVVDKRHDNVKRTIESLADQAVIVRPQIEDEQFKDSMGRNRKPNNGQKLCVHKLSFSLVDLDSDDFLNIVQGDATAIRKWLRRELGWWSATITPTSKRDSKYPLLMNLKPNRKISPQVLIEDMKRDFDQFKAENADFNADDVTVLITISNRKPTSTYGEVQS